jgi:hypothetical protein
MSAAQSSTLEGADRREQRIRGSGVRAPLPLYQGAVYDPTVDADQPRFLARGVGYTAVSHLSIDPAAECVDERTQQGQTFRAHRAWQERQRRRWGAASETINGAVEAFYGNGNGIDRRLAADLRVVKRATDRVGRRLEEELHQAGGA